MNEYILELPTLLYYTYKEKKFSHRGKTQRKQL